MTGHRLIVGVVQGRDLSLSLEGLARETTTLISSIEIKSGAAKQTRTHPMRMNTSTVQQGHGGRQEIPSDWIVLKMRII